MIAQVAGALDAAHRRALVHRDVKPANVLLDPEDHVYLTDFGITKQLGGDSTDTERVVGTLDYLAPEQIRGDPVDGRTDGYALGCVLYECLTGTPPFHRTTEAETLWAHIQEDPPPVRQHTALDPVFRKALAKDREDRYGSCAELVEAADRVLGLDARRHRSRALPARRRHGRLLLAGGLLLAVATVAAALAALRGGEEGSTPPQANGVAAIGAADTELASFTETQTAPSSLAVGEGAAWALSLDERTVTRIDLDSKKASPPIRLRDVPVHITTGAGAVWVLQGESLSRIDPRTSRVSTRALPAGDEYPGDLAFANWGFAQVAVGAGAVWAINPDDRTVSRFDPASGRRVATIPVDAATIAAGPEGVWFISGEDSLAVTPINPRTNGVGRPIRLGAQNLSAVAVGGGYVWASAEGDGLVWRIEPGPRPVSRTIDVGVGVTYLAYDRGVIWTANYREGTVSRFDVETEDVEATPVGAVQGLAAGNGSAWVSTAGATEADGMPETCGERLGGAAAPDVLIASDLPLQGHQGASTRVLADAIRFVLEERDYRAGKYTIGYRSCDDSTAQIGLFDRRRCAANANAYARAEQLVAVIGPYNSDCAQIEIPILNRAPGGPLAIISPSNTGPGLTRTAEPPPRGFRGEPDIYYPTGVRNYLRLPPHDDMHGAAHTLLAEQLGLKRVFVLDDGSVFWRNLLSEPFRYAARRQGVDLAGSAAFPPERRDYNALATRIERSGADGLVLGADPYTGGDRLLRELRARLGSRVTIMAGFFFATEVPEVLELTHGAARGIYAAQSELPGTALELTPRAERFADRFGGAEEPFALEAAQAAELLMQAIARSDGTRASVLEQLKASRVTKGILGSFSFDANGDRSPASVPILRITGSTPPGAGLPSLVPGRGSRPGRGDPAAPPAVSLSPGRRLPAFTESRGALQPPGARVCLDPAAKGGWPRRRKTCFDAVRSLPPWPCWSPVPLSCPARTPTMARSPSPETTRARPRRSRPIRTCARRIRGTRPARR